jgi:hypothetical protein
MTRDEAVSNFLASVLTVWHETPAAQLKAIGSATIVLQLGTATLVAAEQPEDDDEAEAA